MRRALWIIGLVVWPWAASAQQSDKDFLTSYLEANLSGAGRVVTITGFAGALSSRATMAEMTIADDQGIWLTIKDVALDWSQSSLLSGRIVINEFTAGEIDVQRLPTKDPNRLLGSEAKGFSLPDLPVSVDVESIAAGRIVLGPSVLGQGVEGQLSGSMHLAGGEGGMTLDLTRTDAVREGHFLLKADYLAQTNQLTLSLSAKEGAGGVAVGLLGVPGAPSAELSIAGTGPLDTFAADISLKTNDVTRLAGQVALFSAEGGQGFTADLAGDPTPVFLPNYAAFFGPKVALHAKGQRFADGRMELQEFAVRAQALSLDGTVNLDASGAPEAFALTGNLGLQDGAVVLPLTTEQPTRLESGTLSLDFDRSKSQDWTFSALLNGLTHSAFRAERVVLSGGGRIGTIATGSTFDGTVSFGADGLNMVDPGLALALGPTLDGKTSIGWQTGGAVRLEGVSLRAGGLNLTGAATVGGLDTELAIEGHVDGVISEVSRFSILAGAALKGRAEGGLTFKGNLLSGIFQASGTLHGRGLGFGVQALDHLMQGETSVDFTGRRDTTGTTIEGITLKTASLEARFGGRITAQGADLTGDVNFGNLSALGTGYGGALQGKMALTGPLETIRVTVDAAGTDLAIGQSQVDGLFAGKSTVALAVSLDHGVARVERADLTLSKGNVQATGRVAAAGNDIMATVNLSDLRALGWGLRGALIGDVHFTGQPTQGRLLVEATAQELGLGQPQLDLLLRGQSRLTADLDLTTDGLGVRQVDLSNPQVRMTAKGTVSGTLRRLDLEQRIFDLGLLYPPFPGVLVTKGTAIQDAGGYNVDLLAKGPGQIDARVKGRLTSDFRRADLAINGTATAALANNLAAPRSLSGPVRFDLRMRGPIAVASLSGPVTISGGRLADPARTFGLQDISGTATLAGGQARVQLRTTVTTGGQIAVEGTVGLTAPYPARLAVKVENAVLKDPSLYTTSLNGNLTIEGPIIGSAVVAGTATLGRTELRIPSTGFASDGDLPELQHVREPTDSRATRDRAGQFGRAGGTGSGQSGYILNLQVLAPNQVFIRGRGLDAELGGSLILRGTTDAIVPSGAFNLIRGRLDILGRRLDLSQALLQLQGALVPFVRIVASVESDGITAAVLIEGEANDPVVSFTSSPDLPQEEVLARLLFDRGLENLTAFQAIQLAGAVATLAGRGGEGVIGNLRKRAGLDNLDVTTGATGAATVTVGKYLSEKVYTEAVINQGGNDSISLNLDISPHITLKAQVDSAGQTGLGLFLQRDY